MKKYLQENIINYTTKSKNSNYENAFKCESVAFNEEHLEIILNTSSLEKK
jgi:hypothetical protein